MARPRHVILGTAGHIDHGKSALVKALTGTDPDRLKEEKARGITIDLGFADLAYPDGTRIGIVDVPGHERLIKNMLAGAGGIDYVALVIAADEGIMPQSREHLAICDLLGIQRGVVVISKSDLVDEEWLELVTEEVTEFVAGTFLENAPVQAVSAKTGAGIDELKTLLYDVARSAESKPAQGLFRLPIDRVFTLKGFGTVVTGTALAGTLPVESPVEILPSGRRSRVRGLQCHGESIREARAGMRVAVNLPGIETEELRRGDVVTEPDRVRITTVLDVSLRLLGDAPPVRSRQNVHLHVGTDETVARIIVYGGDKIPPGGETFAQLRLAHPIVALAGDRFVIRRYSPLATMGGGVILDPTPRRRKRADGVADLETFARGDLEASITVKVLRETFYGMPRHAIHGWIRGERPAIDQAIAALIKQGVLIEAAGRLIHAEGRDRFRTRTLEALKRYHRDHPMKPGIPKEELRGRFRGIEPRLFEELLGTVREAAVEGGVVRSAGFKPKMNAADEATKTTVLGLFEAGGFQPPLRADVARSLKSSEQHAADILALLAREGTLVRMTDAVYLSKNAADDMLRLLREHFSRQEEMTVAEFRDLLGTTRKFALPFLEYLDSTGVTLRVGDTRKSLMKSTK